MVGKMNDRIIITGGLGYIGSHILVELGSQYDIKIIDNLSNSAISTLEQILKITSINYNLQVIDVLDTNRLIDSFIEFKPTLVLHLAGKKSVPESINFPLEYYENNVQGTISVLKAMDASDCKKIIFSSSATVYGNPEYLPIDERHPTQPLNPYGESKLMAEKVIQSWCETDMDKSAISLRYFNPIGAHHSAKLCENGPQRSTNLMPTLLRSINNDDLDFTVFGNSYDTEDGSAIRDYIHVEDLALAHLSALEQLDKITGYTIYNVGTGKGTSVFEIIKSFEIANGVSVQFKVGSNRNGDAPEIWATPKKISKDTGWSANKSVMQMCKDAWCAHKEVNEQK